MSTERIFPEACRTLENALKGSVRAEILDVLCKSKTFNDALAKLGSAMRTHTFKTQSGQLILDKFVKALDERTQEDGFHVLIDWDGKANRWNDDIIPIDVLVYFSRAHDSRVIGAGERQSLSILLDYYFLYVLALLAMRVGDEGHTPDNVECVTSLIAELQRSGSGQRFVDDTGTLILIGTAHFEPDGAAYERLIARIRATWSESQRVQMALPHASILGSHLRHGFRDVYLKDLGLMRDDNGPDYPCLCFALLTLIREYARMHEAGLQGPERAQVVEGILSGLTADPRAFIGKPPAPLANYIADQAEFSATFRKYQNDLLQEFELFRPSERYYSAIAFNFNFPHNLLKGIVVDSLLRQRASAVSVNDLLTGIPQKSKGRELLARSLMGYARQVPDNLGNRPVPVISYDPSLGLRDFVRTIGTIRELTTEKI